MLTTEVKFGDIDKTFPGVSKFSFDHLLNTFQFTNQTLSTIYFNNNTKKSINHNLSIVYTNKKCIDYQYNEDYNLHYFTMEEQIIDEPELFTTNYSKDKIKTNYQFTKNILLELSETTIKNDDELVNAYEVELKITNRDPLADQIIKKIVQLLQQSDTLYTRNEWLLVKPNRSLVKTRPIQIKDLKVDQLYIVSTKAKGLRCQLVIHFTGVWFIFKHYANRIIHTDNPYFNYFINSFSTSVFDGELITSINSNRYEFNYKYWFLCYDCLMFNKADVRHLNYGERIDYAKTLKRLMTWVIDPFLFTVDLKTTKPFSNREEMRNSVEYILNIGEVLNYQHNGLIFTPVLQPYNTIVYKWVYPSMVTIDFAIYPNGKDVKLYLYNEEVKKDVEFMGTPPFPFDESMILQSSFNVTKKQIGECRWDAVFNKMVLIKIRDDKEEADSIDLAIENWQQINHPIIDCQN